MSNIFGMGRAIHQLAGEPLAGKPPEGFPVDAFRIEQVSMDSKSTTATLWSGAWWVKLTVVGDCCSESYFDANTIETLRGLVGQRLDGWEDRELRVESRTIYYALVITTDQGEESLMWRNDSNGYYAGWVEVALGGGAA